MQITVSQSALLAELALAQGAVERKTTIPVLGMVKVQTAGNYIVITSTDLEIGFKSRVPAVVEKEGEVLIPAKNLYDYISHLPDKDISITVTPKGVNLKCARSSRRMPVIGAASFPDLPKLGKPTAAISAKALAGLLTKVSFAISSEESRFVLNAALLVLSPGKVKAVATDGHRLALASYLARVGDLEKEVKALLSRKCVAEVIKLASKSADDANVNVYVQDDHLYFGFGDRLLYSRVVAGNFPAYERVIPSGQTDSAVVISSEMRESLSRIETFADSRSKAAILSFSPSGISITSSTAETGDGEEQVDSRLYKGEKVDIKLNCQYVIDFLKMVDGDVQISFKDSSSAVDMKLAGDDTYRYICMPMNLGV